MLNVILLVFAFVLAVVAGVLGAPNPPANPWSWRMACWAAACYFLAEILARGGSVLKLG